MQFNADVNRKINTEYRHDTIKIRESTFHDGHSSAEQGVYLNFHFAGNTQQLGSVPNPLSSPALVPDTSREDFPGRNAPGLMPQVASRSKSSLVMLDNSCSSPLPTPLTAASVGPITVMDNGLIEANRQILEYIQRKVSVICDLYETLSEKLERFHRVSGLSHIRKDLTMQKTIFDINVEQGWGNVISSVAQALQRSQLLPSVSSTNMSLKLEPNPRGIVDGIKARLDRIHHNLKDVDSLSDELAAQQDRLSLPIRQKRDVGKVKSDHHHQSAKNIATRSGVMKRRQSLSSRHKPQTRPDVVIRLLTTLLTSQLEEFSRECQVLQPAERDATPGAESIPHDVEIAKTAVELLFKALCQACPNKNHVHSVLFGLSTQELSFDEETENSGFEFSIAFESTESRDEPETWFVVQSTMKPQGTLPQTDQTDGLETISYASPEPNARFCLQYHKQGTSDLAAALRHSNKCEHELFYPDEARLKFIRENDDALPLRQLLDDLDALQQLEPLQKIRIAKLLAEAVLKFHAADWLSDEWDWDDVFVYKIDGSLEPHLRFRLKSTEVSHGQEEPEIPQVRSMADILCQLGAILGTIAVGPFAESPTYGAVRDSLGSHAYAEIYQACVDLSKMRTERSDVEVQGDFYSKVVAKLDWLEAKFIEENEEFM